MRFEAGQQPLLTGEFVRLEPLERRHAAELALAVEENRSTYAFTWVPQAADIDRYLDLQLDRAAEGSIVPYTQISAVTGRAVGVTAYCEPRAWLTPDHLDAVEVGHTWLGASAQGTGINAEAKLLLFRHAFEVWRVSRVDLKTDARNARSRAAIMAVGATLEGVLRNWSPSKYPGEEGMLRDSAIFSLTAEEWPHRRAALESRVARYRITA
ncbi:MAG TPA: GNAT family protein [Streptomyces sp.]